MQLQIHEDVREVAEAVAGEVLEALGKAIQERGEGVAVLAGGSTFAAAYALLATPEYNATLDWTKAQLYFGDERYVPVDDERSNYGAAARAWFEKLSENVPQVAPVDTSLSAIEAAAAYAALLPEAVDILLLGLGSDGHTASLFPHSEEAIASSSLVAVTEAGLEPFVERITLTPKAFLRSKRTVVAATGSSKAEIVKAVQEDEVGSYPITRIELPNSVLMLDRQAAAQL